MLDHVKDEMRKKKINCLIIDYFDKKLYFNPSIDHKESSKVQNTESEPKQKVDELEFNGNSCGAKIRPKLPQHGANLLCKIVQK